MNLQLLSFLSLRVRLIFFILLLFSIRAYSQLNTSIPKTPKPQNPLMKES